MTRFSNPMTLLPLFAFGLVLVTLTLGTATVTWAASLNDEIQHFHRFLSHHPKVAADLQRDPSLASDSRYVNHHGDFQDFLHKHPRLRRELAANPGYVLGAPYAWNSAPYSVAPPYTVAPAPVHPPYAVRPRVAYPPYATRRYGNYRPYDHRPHKDDRRHKREHRQ